jgi:hypothetical protein
MLGGLDALPGGATEGAAAFTLTSIAEIAIRSNIRITATRRTGDQLLAEVF